MKQKVTNQLNVVVPRGSFVDEGDGVVSFPDGLTITDDSVQRNGTRYDINTLDISRYGGQLTGDHEDKLSSLIGETIGTVKQNGRVTVNKIRYAINANPYARLAYDLLVNGFSKNFSIETIGLPPDPSDGVYYDAELVGLSQVVTQNNYSAHVNQLVHNSLEHSKQDGLDVTGIEEKVLKEFAANAVEKENMEEKQTETPETETKITPEVTEVETTEVVEETPVEKTEEVVEAPAENAVEVEEPTEEKVVVEEAEVTETEVVETPAVEAEVVETPAEETIVETPTEETNTNKEKQMEDKTTEANAIAEAIKNALAPFATELAEIKEAQKNAFDKSAVEPEFKATEVAKNDYASMDFTDRYQEQVTAAWNAVKMNNVEAWKTLNEINEVNLGKLKEAGIAKNAMTLDDLGNFVIAPEMHKEIVGHRNDYSAIINATEWKETLSLEFAWLQRVGDIDMQNVALGDDGADGNLKPISEYSAVPKKSELEELAAVTVVATSATRFAAVDLLSDAAAGYRNDFDRKRAQLVIAKLEQAVDTTGQSVSYAPATDADALTAWLTGITEVSDVTLNGTLIFNARTFAELKSRAIQAGANGPLSEILTTGDIPTIFGYKFIVVPNDLMPTLGAGNTVTHYVEGEPVVINHAVFFADLSVFTGRTSGGLIYDVSSHASYEGGGVTKSAYQRNELVLRGSFFRGGAVVDASRVAGIRAGTANVS